MNKTLLLASLLLICACASTAAEQTGIVGAGFAGLIGVWDALAQAKVITPLQNAQFQHALGGVQQTVDAAIQMAQAAKDAAASVKAGTFTTGEAIGVSGTLTAAGLTALNAVRNFTRARVVEKITAV